MARSDDWLSAEIAREPWLFCDVEFDVGYFDLLPVQTSSYGRTHLHGARDGSPADGVLPL